jgi:thiol:disulfide interchange protein
MLVLALAMLALRAAGTAVGWGFQFQEPLFVAAVTLVVVAFALNLFGVFEIQLDTGGLAALGAEATGARRSFFEGLLAVVLATPCSAPFLGTAVGFAFAGSSAQILAVFLAIGTGLALPFVLVTLVPGWSRVVPRSGAWMLELRKGLGFALLGSAVWLLWILGRAAGNGAVIEMLALLVAAAFALWVYGTLQASGRRLWRGVAAVGLATVIVAGLNVVSLESAPEAQDRPASEVAWSAFEPASVQARLAEGRAVFVVFTADWCLTCKMNERLVLSDERVREEIERLGVAVFRADWTQRDERIRAELARFGRAGVPMYLLYAPGSPGEPRVLPEVLTVEGTLRALRAAAADGATRIADAR